RLRQLVLYLRRALYIYIEQKVISFLFGVIQKASRGAVVVVMDLGMFEKLVFAHHLFKFGARDEVILLAVAFAAARRACGVGNRKFQSGNNAADFVYQGGFARAGGRGDDVDSDHSRFCTCSRTFSISDLMESPDSVIFSASPARPEVLESRV